MFWFLAFVYLVIARGCYSGLARWRDDDTRIEIYAQAFVALIWPIRLLYQIGRSIGVWAA